MPRAKSQLTGGSPRSLTSRQGKVPGISIRWTEEHHLTYLRLGGSRWLRATIDAELAKRKETK